MTDISDNLKSVAVSAGGLIAAVAAEAPWPVAVLIVVLCFAFAVFQRPDLAREWLKIRCDFKRRH